MRQYKTLMNQILELGNHRPSRSGGGTLSRFGVSTVFDLSEGFPLLTLREINYRSVVAELIWFLSGSTDVKRLQSLGSGIWNQWQGRDGTIGPMYGQQWRNAHAKRTADGKFIPDSGVDQIANLVQGLRTTPYSRRHVVDSWDSSLLPDESIAPSANVDQGRMALPPCHPLFQLYVEDLPAGQSLSLLMFMRSQDLPIGMPFNVASYALLLCLLANTVGMIPNSVVYMAGDIHIYQDQHEAVELMGARECLALPTMVLEPHMTIEWASQASPEVLEALVGCLSNYHPHPPIKIPVAT